MGIPGLELNSRIISVFPVHQSGLGDGGGRIMSVVLIYDHSEYICVRIMGVRMDDLIALWVST